MCSLGGGVRAPWRSVPGRTPAVARRRGASRSTSRNALEQFPRSSEFGQALRQGLARPARPTGPAGGLRAVVAGRRGWAHETESVGVFAAASLRRVSISSRRVSISSCAV